MTSHIQQLKCPQPRNGEVSAALALIFKECAAHSTPAWESEVALRRSPSPAPIPGDREIMRRICVAIAYSQGARSAQIEGLITTRVFKEAFADFKPSILARRDPNWILDKYWPKLGHFRFRGKIRRIVQCAQALNGIARDHGSFAEYLEGFGIPRRIRSEADLGQFWGEFDELRKDLHHRRMPFFRSTTSLLQLLLDLDFDSVKPDLIIMRLARRIGIVDRETGDRALRQCVRSLQVYAFEHSRRATELDLALLAFGGQTGAGRLLSQRFCPPNDPCDHRACPLGRNWLCMARQAQSLLLVRNT